MAILICTCPEDAVRWICYPRPHIIISITDPPPWGEDRRVKFLENDQLLDALHLQFLDIHEKHFGIQVDTKRMAPVKGNGTPLKNFAMTPSHADCVREFLENWWGKFDTLIIHCAAGVSRSPSMALAIAEKIGVSRHAIEPCGRDWTHQPFNPHVYRLTKDALEKWNI